jgi:hypothetical protein
VKVTINGAEMRTTRVGDWTFLQADKVRQITAKMSEGEEPGLMPGDILTLLLSGDSRAALSFAIVAYMLDGQDPSVLPDMVIESVVVDFSDESDGDGSPPAEGDAAAKRKKPAARAPRVKKSAQKN